MRNSDISYELRQYGIAWEVILNSDLGNQDEDLDYPDSDSDCDLYCDWDDAA